MPDVPSHNSMMLPATADAPMSRKARAILDGESSAASRVLIFGICGVLAMAFLWAAWAHVDEVVIARGTVEPADRVQTVNHHSGGRVASLLVEDGQFVESGDVLLSFAPEQAEFRMSEARSRWQLAQARVLRLEAEIEDRPLQVAEPLASERPDLVAREHELMAARAETQLSRRQTLERKIEGKGSDLRRATADVERLGSSLELLQQQLEAIEALAERGLYPRLKVIEMQRQANDMVGERGKADAVREAAQAALSEARVELERLDNGWQESLIAELAEANAELETLASRLASETTEVAETVLRAPISGIVQDLQVTGVSQAVAAHQPLMKIVPTEGGLVVKAQVANDDIGRVAADMLAAVKVHAYDFARYGSLSGKVEQVAADATSINAGSPPTYSVTVITDDSFIGGDPLNKVLPGMEVDVELSVGKRSILSYFTDTVVDYRDKAFRDG